MRALFAGINRHYLQQDVLNRTDKGAADQNGAVGKKPEISLCPFRGQASFPRKVVQQLRAAVMRPDGYFMSAFECDRKSYRRIAPNHPTRHFPQLRNVLIGFIDIVIASDCQYYF